MEAAKESPPSVKERLDEPLYNSRLAQNYLEYIRKNYPYVDIDHLLKGAGLSRAEVEDPAHWLTQNQMDNFNRVVVKETGNEDISREVGRYSALASASGLVRKYLRRFLTPKSAYWMLERISALLTKATSVSVRGKGGNKVEITVQPCQGVREKPYQCLNRLGMFEALAKVFTGKYAIIEHNNCYHREGNKCIYIVSWEMTPSMTWRILRNYSFFLLIAVPAIMFHFLTVAEWLGLSLVLALLSLVLSVYSSRLERSELSGAVERDGDSAKALLDEMRRRYDNAMLIQEVGQATSTVLDRDKLLKAMASTMERRLDFDRGMILLADRKKEKLIYGAGFGYTADQERLLKGTSFDLTKPEAKGLFVKAFKEQKAFLIRNISEMEDQLSAKSLELARSMGVQSMICVPIVYEVQKEALGIIAVDNVKSKRPLSQSDLGLLRGIAGHTAVTLANAQSFQLLQISEKKYRDLVENASTLVLRLDTEGRIAFFNEFAQRVFGYGEEEVIGKELGGILQPPEVNSKKWVSDLLSCFNATPEEAIVREESHSLKNGSNISVSWIYKPVFLENGLLSEVMCIGIDITRLKQAEEEKKALEAQLAHTQRIEAIGTLAGGIAHDFNNILSAIIGYTELALYVTKEEAKKRHQLEEVLKAAQRAKELIRQILTFSRQTDTQKKAISLTPVVKEAMKLLRASLPTTIEIVQDFGSEPGVVVADPTQIHQIVMNLCTNAHHAMLRTGGVLTVKIRNVAIKGSQLRSFPELEGGDYVKLSISDTGHGMDRATAGRIFEPYFTTKEKGMGTGLGLAVVHGIVKGYKGAIRVKSAPGKGAAFDIYLPRVEAPSDSKELVSEQQRGQGEKVLIVDDEAAIVEVAAQMLESLGYTVETSTDPLEALKAFEKDPFSYDLIITDMTMPRLTGDNLSRRILQVRPEMPIILCTGYSKNTIEESVREIGIKQLATKPLIIGELAAIVRKALTA